MAGRTRRQRRAEQMTEERMADGVRMRPEWECSRCLKRNFIERTTCRGRHRGKQKTGGETMFQYRDAGQTDGSARPRGRGHGSSSGGKGGSADGYPAPASHTWYSSAGKGGSADGYPAPASQARRSSGQTEQNKANKASTDRTEPAWAEARPPTTPQVTPKAKAMPRADEANAAAAFPAADFPPPPAEFIYIECAPEGGQTVTIPCMTRPCEPPPPGALAQGITSSGLIWACPHPGCCVRLNPQMCPTCPKCGTAIPHSCVEAMTKVVRTLAAGAPATTVAVWSLCQSP